MFIVLCNYKGARHSNPLLTMKEMEAVGPFKTFQEASEYSEKVRFETCKEHDILPILGKK